MIKSFTSGFLIILMMAIGGLTLFRADTNVSFEYKRLLNGQLATELEQQLKSATPLKDELTEAWAKFFLLAFNQGSKGVLIGKSGWLYSREEYLWPTDALDNTDRNIETITSIQARLTEKNIALAIVLVPEKVSVYDEHLVEPSAHVVNDIHAKIVSDLRQRGIHVVSPLAQLREVKDSSQVYLKTDTHWTPEGAALVAQYAALQLEDWQGDQAFVTSVENDALHHGDLFNFLPIQKEWLYPRIAPDNISKSTTYLEDADSFDLFAEPEPIAMVLVGTSYSADPTWNFHGQIQQAFSREVLDYSEIGQGPIKPMLLYLQSEAFTSEEIRYVLWEFPVRYFVQDLSVKDNE